MFQLINARPHTARAVQAFLAQEDIHTLPCLAFSPDMSPTKHAWDMLGYVSTA
uniref:Tc1-like transposase DDE domain-containing protein n=1 Tax=Amphilophus citrinellus TaxID=61819 RepID=A0A3Q0RIV1_AMPCI